MRNETRDPTLLFWRWLSGFLVLVVMMLLGALGVVTSHLVNEAELAKDVEQLEERIERNRSALSQIESEYIDRRLSLVEEWIRRQDQSRRGGSGDR